jgi:hypothetical protein
MPLTTYQDSNKQISDSVEKKMMEFKKLNADTNCNCLENSEDDLDECFAIKTMKDKLRIQDFESLWEKGKRPDDKDCQTICSLKGKSMSIFSENTKDKVIEIFKGLFPFSPKYKPYICVVKFNNSSGNFKHTPDNINPFHYDFYKCDTFDFTQVELIGVNELR